MPPVQFEDRAYLKLAACRDGVMLFNPLDSFVGRSLDLYGEFSRGEAAVFDQIVAPGDTVLDVGANIGAHTLWMARRVGPAGSVIAFEPQRAVFQTLCANMALNGMTNCRSLLGGGRRPTGLRHRASPRPDGRRQFRRHQPDLGPPRR